MEKMSDNNLKIKTAYIKFVDVDKFNSQSNKQVGDSISFQGRSGKSYSLNLTLPKKYELASNYSLPDKYTFLENKKNILVIPLVHKKEVEEIVLIGRRIINYKIADKNGIIRNLNDGQQKLEFKAKKITDLLTGKIYYDWQKEQDKYSSVTTPVEKGYFASQIQADNKKISIGKLIANHQEVNGYISIIYRPLGYIIQQDINGNELAKYSYINASDSTKAAEIPIPSPPSDYQPISNLPSSISPNDPEEHRVLTYRLIKPSQLHKVTRMITEIQTNESKKIHLQEVEFVKVDGAWKLAPGTKLKWNIITPDVPEGYVISSVKKANGENYNEVVRKENDEIFAIDAVKPSFDTPNEDLTVFIKPILHQTTIEFIDVKSHDRQIVKSIPLEGRTDETVALNINQRDIPADYELTNTSQIPKQYHFNAKYNSAVIVSVKKVDTKKTSLKIKLY